MNYSAAVAQNLRASSVFNYSVETSGSTGGCKMFRDLESALCWSLEQMRLPGWERHTFTLRGSDGTLLIWSRWGLHKRRGLDRLYTAAIAETITTRRHQALGV